MSRQFIRDYFYEVSLGNVEGYEGTTKYGRNPNINTVDGFEAIWNGGGDYTGFNATVKETLEVYATGGSEDSGTLVSSGTATGGSHTTLIDTDATFISDGVAVGDCLINDTQAVHGIVSEVTGETTLTVYRMFNHSSNEATNMYRVATSAGTGAAVLQLQRMLDGTTEGYITEYVILNGTTAVDTVGEYLRASRAKCIIAGSAGSNVRALTVRQKTTTANIFVVIPIGYGSTMIACDTIPIGFVGDIVDWTASLSGKTNASCGIRLYTRPQGEIFRVVEEFAIQAAGSSSIPRKLVVAKTDLHPMTDIKIMADTDTNNTAIAASFDLILRDRDIEV